VIFSVCSKGSWHDSRFDQRKNYVALNFITEAICIPSVRVSDESCVTASVSLAFKVVLLFVTSVPPHKRHV
jgi:hypothetical protein